jgi:hypothetical protein
MLYHRPQASLVKPFFLTVFFLGIIAGLCAGLFWLKRQIDKESLAKFYSFIFLVWLAGFLLLFNKSPLPFLFLGFPLLLLIFYDAQDTLENFLFEKPGIEGVIFTMIILYLSISAIILRRNPDLDLRYLLAVVPMAIIFLGFRLRAQAPLRLILLIVCGFSLAALFLNMFSLKNKFLLYEKYNSQRVKFLSEHTKAGDAIIFPANPLMEHCGPLFFERIFIVSTGGEKELLEVLKKLKEKGFSHGYYWVLEPNAPQAFLKSAGYPCSAYQFRMEKLSVHYLIKIEL